MERKMTFEAKIKPWGNSLGITLPKERAREFGLKEGDVVEIDLRPRRSIGEAFGALPDIEERAGMPLADFLKKMDDEMRSKWD